ncbi:MAG TPA: DegT/DnrJ/EryC1/StrS family aminotransferase [Planctomycetes bacterium]|nr:DegT/DnrJ/EryC1/StrS family aminotransferase [Planctomycetota bacterium]
MTQRGFTRRNFLKAATAGTIAATATGPLIASSNSTKKLAIHGGDPVHRGGWPRWPIWDKAHDEQRVLEVLRSGVWSRRNVVAEFEKKYAALMGTKRCLATTNGTNALITALSALDIGAGDEVLVGPYTFVATVDAILLVGALPVFVDTDRETFTVDPEAMEDRITESTRAILPVHILGLPADMDKITALAKKHNLRIVEDACQAWMAEWRGKKVGSIGDLGCFSFQNSKNLTCGEGGAIIGDDERLMDICYSFHNFGRPYGTVSAGRGCVRLGTKARMAEYQAAILLAQMERLEEQTSRRVENAAHLTSRLEPIPGIIPHKLNDGATRAAYHLYAFRYQQEEFGGVPRSTFLRALSAEGVPCSGGYSPLNKCDFLEHAFQSKNFKKMYSPKQIERARQLSECPENDRLCTEAVWIFQSLLLGSRQDMDDIADAVEKIYENRDQLV